ncbi:MAG: dTDP-4-dehydrorhamnose reductase [Methanobacteriaceae archaeon]
MKIMVTGANGMLGTDLVEFLSSDNEVIATDLPELDITNISNLKEFIGDSFDVVINTAAYTAVDDCETNKEIAYNVNAIGPKNLAIRCREIGATLVHISTDYVFDGEKSEGYLEDDETNPQSVYGETKLEGEEFIMENLDDYYILRTAWLYGANGPSFPKTMLELGKNNSEVSVVNDQFGNPTYTKDLCLAIKGLLDLKADFGIYHATGTLKGSWYDFAVGIFEIAGMDVKVKPVDTSEFPRPAKRPKFSVLDNRKLKSLGIKLNGYDEVLEEFIDGLEV